MVDCIDDDGMMMEDGGEMDLLYREEGEEDESNRRERERPQESKEVRITQSVNNQGDE